jgi:hypothetical protein
VTGPVYTTKTPAERVAAKLTGEVYHKHLYKCRCHSSAKWAEVCLAKLDRQSKCPKCGAWRLPVETWEV